MTVLQAKARNHDDVEFSYLAVQRGVDQRTGEDNGLTGKGVVQGAEATERAKRGYGVRRRKQDEDIIIEGQNEEEAAESLEVNSAQDTTITEEEATSLPHPLSLPRILPNPLKRKGHILIDVCTPSGTYERWMVRRGIGKQAFRDARKAKWGDLWALGASSTEPRRVKLGTPVEVVKMADKRARERAKGWRKGREGGRGKWRFDGGSGSGEV
jgi:ribosomal protein RSM22 (predicted rRNA methylase)